MEPLRQQEYIHFSLAGESSQKAPKNLKATWFNRRHSHFLGWVQNLTILGGDKQEHQNFSKPVQICTDVPDDSGT